MGYVYAGLRVRVHVWGDGGWQGKYFGVVRVWLA